MLRNSLPFLILAFAAMSTAAAIQFLPETLYFPVVEYSASEDLRVALFKTGELDRSNCERTTRLVANNIRANCPTCKIAQRCERGLQVEHRDVLSNEPLSIPSLRSPGGKLTMTISASDTQAALDVCRQMEQQLASRPADQRLRCYPALAPR
jgi:hypothetical protein